MTSALTTVPPALLKLILTIPHFLKLPSQWQSSAAIAPTVPAAPSYNISEGPKHVEPSSMQYSAEKISELNSDENFSMLLYVIESYLGRPLSIKETNAIVYFYDSLDFSIDL